MPLREVAKQVTAMNSRIAQLEKAAASPTQRMTADRFKNNDPFVAESVYVVAGNQRVQTTTIANDTRAIVISLESSTDTVGSGKAWAMCATGGQAWVQYKSGESPAATSYVNTSDEAGKVAFSSSTTLGSFGRVSRIDTVNNRVLVFFSKQRVATIKVPLVEDSYVNGVGLQRDVNFDGEPLQVDRFITLSQSKTAFLRPAAGAPAYVETIDRVTLVLYQLSSHDISGPLIHLRYVLAGWDESTITWNNSNGVPGFVSEVTTARIGLRATPQIVSTTIPTVGSSVPLTFFINGFRLHHNRSAENVQYASSENEDPDKRPYLTYLARI